MEKAYKNMKFLTSRDARTIRILSEYLEPLSRFQHYDVTDTVVFFGSARAIPENEAAKRLERAKQANDELQVAVAERELKLARYYEEAEALARLMTEWSKELQVPGRRFITCSGGGPGIMEAANRGASNASGISIGLGISLPKEPGVNRFATRELAFEFHYFFMRKFWFVYLAKAMVVFPGGFGTMDELFELLTLVQTRKMDRPLPIVLYGSEFWNDVVNFDALVRWGTISPEDLGLFEVCDTPEQAFDFLTRELTRLHDGLGS